MAETITCRCGNVLDSKANFCNACGNRLSSMIACPRCGHQVAPGNFCAKCGSDLKTKEEAPDFADGIWQRGVNDFAVRIPARHLESGRGDSVEVRHGTKALFFESGRLVDEADSGRYPTRERGAISELLKKGRKVSAILVDAGDTLLNFVFSNIRTRDRLLATISTDLVVRMENPNRFFVNVMKERDVFKLHDLRQVLFPEMQNALQEAAAHFDFDDLNLNLATKTELASRMEVHLRRTLESTGLGFEQVRTISVAHQAIDAADQRRAGDDAAARAVETETLGRIRKANAEMAAASADRQLRSRKLDADREDMDLDSKAEDVRLYQKAERYRKEFDARMLDADHLAKRLAVLKRIREVDVDTIKTDEDFRKFKGEVDRDNLLDEAEWEAFRDELVWRGEDRRRDRAFLVAKIDLQQRHDQDMIALANHGDYSLEEKKRQAEERGKELEWQLQRAMKAVQGEVDIRLAKAAVAAKEQRIKDIGLAEIEAEQALMKIRLRKEDDLAGHEKAKLEVEEKRLKSRLGMDNLERLKLIKAAEKDRDQVRDLERQHKELEMQLAREAAAHKRVMDRYGAMAGMGIEQLIAISGGSQAGILGDLAQSQTLKGMSAEEIMAMRDPSALGKALEERAKSVGNDEMKALYERMLAAIETASNREAAALRESAERMERLAGEGFRALSGKNRQLADSEQRAGERIVTFAERTVDRLGRAAAGGASSPREDDLSARVVVCRKCRAELPKSSDFCSNCGEKV